MALLNENHHRLELILLVHYQRQRMVIVSSSPWLTFFLSGQKPRHYQIRVLNQSHFSCTKWCAGIKSICIYLLHCNLYNFYVRYGCTKVVISDQGREFVNKVNQCLFKMTNTEHRISSAYHPQTNGLVERFNQTLQRSLVKLVNNNQDDWDGLLDSVLFAYRTAKQKSTQISPFELMYCRWVVNYITEVLTVIVELNNYVEKPSYQSKQSLAMLANRRALHPRVNLRKGWTIISRGLRSWEIIYSA